MQSLQNFLNERSNLAKVLGIGALSLAALGKPFSFKIPFNLSSWLRSHDIKVLPGRARQLRPFKKTSFTQPRASWPEKLWEHVLY